MKRFLITTDSTCDLPDDFVKEYNVPVISLYYIMDGVSYGPDCQMAPQTFYAKMRDGLLPTTNAMNPEGFIEKIRPYVAEGYDILHIAFSSGLSSTCQNAFTGANTLMEEFPDRKIIVIDSLSASLGQGLVVYKAVMMKEQGKSMEEIAEWLKANILHFCHQFTVNDLFHLHRGGRVSKTAAIVGTLVNLKPVLHVDDEGLLKPVGKSIGRKKSLNALVDNMGASLGDWENDTIFLGHGDCLEDAKYVAAQVKSRFGIDCKIINYISPTIGAHSGPGTVALFFMGEKR